MPLYAGFDIGIKNLAFCIIETNEWKEFRKGTGDDPGIKLWRTINLVGESATCMADMRSGKNKGTCCNKKASWMLETQGLDNVTTEYYCGTHKNEWCIPYKQAKIKNLNMRLLKKKAFEELDAIKLFDNVVHIAIESQPRINQQMKMFAASIDAYFIIRQNIDNPNSKLRAIRASPAKNKLKLYNGPPISVDHIKDPYDRRKYLAQKQTEYFLRRAPDVLNELYYPSKKRDDLADSFLHCILAIDGLK